MSVHVAAIIAVVVVFPAETGGELKKFEGLSAGFRENIQISMIQ